MKPCSTFDRGGALVEGQSQTSMDPVARDTHMYPNVSPLFASCLCTQFMVNLGPPKNVLDDI